MCVYYYEEWMNQKYLRLQPERITGLQIQFASASIAYFAHTVSATFKNTPRNVGHILPGQFGQCFCSPLSDPLGQQGALTQRYQGRERKACSVTESIPQGGAGVRSNMICPFYLWGEACGEISSLYAEQAIGTGHLRSTQFSFSFWHLSFTYLHPHCIFGDYLPKEECVLRKLPYSFHGASSWCTFSFINRYEHSCIYRDTHVQIGLLYRIDEWTWIWGCKLKLCSSSEGLASGRFCWIQQTDCPVEIMKMSHLPVKFSTQGAIGVGEGL